MWRCRDRRFASALPSAEARAYHCALPAQNGRLSVATSAMRAAASVNQGLKRAQGLFQHAAKQQPGLSASHGEGV